MSSLAEKLTNKETTDLLQVGVITAPAAEEWLQVSPLPLTILDIIGVSLDTKSASEEWLQSSPIPTTILDIVGVPGSDAVTGPSGMRTTFKNRTSHKTTGNTMDIDNLSHPD